MLHERLPKPAAACSDEHAMFITGALWNKQNKCNKTKYARGYNIRYSGFQF
jgi:hypothetical protein